MIESIPTMPPKGERAEESAVVHQKGRPQVALAVALAAAVLIGAAVYKPWVSTPFDMLDFSEFLPFLNRSDTFAQRFAEFTTYYASQGRLNLLSYSFLIWKWSLFGRNEAAWELARFVQMQCIVVGVYLLLRRLGTSRSGSGLGAALFIASATASPAWIRLTMGEPLGLAAILGASLLASRYQARARWRIGGAAIAGLLTASLLAKEMLVPFVPFVLLLACSLNAQGDFDEVRMTQRNTWVISLTALGVLAVLLPVAIVGLRAGPGAYVSDYAVGEVSLVRLIRSLVVVLVPIPPAMGAAPSLAHMFASGAFLAVVVAGLASARTDYGLHRRYRHLAISAMLLALTGAVVYLPWPNFQNFYGLPFLLVPAIFLAVAVTVIENIRPAWRWVAYSGCTLMLVQGLLYSAHDARRGIASRVVNGSLVDELVANGSADSIVVVMQQRRLDAQAWQSRGPTLARYAKSVLPHERLPVIREAFCSAAQPMIDQGVGSTILVSYSTSCGRLPRVSREIRYDYTYLEWPTLIPRRDSLVVSIVGPEPLR